MEEKIKELQKKAAHYSGILTKKEKRAIYFSSVENFLLFLNRFERQDIKSEIIPTLQAYFWELDEGNFSFNITEKRDISLKIIMPIGKHYEKRFSFKQHNNVKVLIFLGVNIDLFLLIMGWSKFVYYIPIITILLVLHWSYIEIFFGRYRRVY